MNEAVLQQTQATHAREPKADLWPVTLCRDKRGKTARLREYSITFIETSFDQP